MSTRHVLITGCGRSGTGYTAELLTRLGLPCGHEKLFNPASLLTAGYGRFGSMRWRLGVRLGTRLFVKPTKLGRAAQYQWLHDEWVESSWLAVPYFADLPAGTTVIHQVRNPVDVVESHVRIQFFDAFSPYRSFAHEHVPSLRQGSVLERGMRYWTTWNRRAEAASDFTDLRYIRVKLEDINVDCLENIVLPAIDFQCSREHIRSVLESVPHAVNTRGDKRRRTVGTWSDLPAGTVKESCLALAEEYGYAVRRT